MSPTRRFFVMSLFVLVLFAAACQQQPAAPPDTRAADAETIRAASFAMSKAATSKDLEKVLSFYAKDAQVLPPNAPLVAGQDAIRQLWTGLIGSPGYALSWQSTKIEVARSGDIAYEVGTYELTLNDPKGKPQTSKGKYTVVLKKQPDNTWKVAVDMWSSDQ